MDRLREGLFMVRSTGGSSQTQTHSGKRVLIVEDEAIIGMLIEIMLMELSHQPIEPCLTFAAGMRAAEHEEIDFAVIDLRLCGTLSYPIGDALERRGIPFVVCTGMAGPEDRASWPVCPKPFDRDMLSGAIDRALH